MRPGDRIESRFEIEREAGAGGTATVFRARDLETGRPAAVKILGAHASRRMFEREARLLSRLHHPCVVGYLACN